MELFEVDFMRRALLAGIIVGLVAPAVGFFLVERRLSLIGDGLGHVAFVGVAVALAGGLSPVVAALVAAVLGALVVEALRSSSNTAGDQALALLFYSGIAGGIVVISAAGAMDASVFAYLFGSVLTVGSEDVAVTALLGALVLASIGLLWRLLAAVAIDEEGAVVAGLPVRRLNLLLAVLAGITVASAMRTVGILLVAALMVLPVMASSRLARSMSGTVVLSMATGVACVVVGLAASWYGDVAPGGSIVLVAAAWCVVVLVGVGVGRSAGAGMRRWGR